MIDDELDRMLEMYKESISRPICHYKGVFSDHHKVRRGMLAILLYLCDQSTCVEHIPDPARKL